MVEHIQYNQDTIRHPNRQAKQITESPYLPQLDGDGYLESQERQEQAMI